MNKRQALSLLALIADLNTIIASEEQLASQTEPQPAPNGVVEKPKAKVT